MRPLRLLNLGVCEHFWGNDPSSKQILSVQSSWHTCCMGQVEHHHHNPHSSQGRGHNDLLNLSFLLAGQ